VAEEEVDLMATPRKRKGVSPSETGHGGKKWKTGSAEASDTEAEKVAKDAESRASKEAVVAKEKAAKEKAKAEKNAKATTAARAPRQDAKDGQEKATDLALTQSPAVEEVVNVEATVNMSPLYDVPSNDFEELHRQLALVHQVCSSSILISAHVYA
jgi:hypothetical protein